MSQKIFNAKIYIAPSALKSTFAILTTLSLLIMLLAGLWVVLPTSIGSSIGLIGVLGLTYTRIFVLMHDLTHRSLFRQNWVNDLFGHILSIFVMTPFYLWRKLHLIHHAEGGNKDHRPWDGDINVATVTEYQTLSPLKKVYYRLYRHPLGLFVFGSFIHFMLIQRLFRGQYTHNALFHARERWSVYGTNIALVLFYGTIIWTLGWQFYLCGFLIPQWISSILGIYLFFSQHNFRDKYFEDSQHWNLQDSALKGSTYHRMHPLLNWFTANIGYHHVHTLAPRIPFYLLPKAHAENPVMNQALQITLRDAPSLVALKLYDESTGKMITWQEYNARYSDEP